MTDRPWRTLILLATLLALLVVFPDTVRSPRLAAARAHSASAVRQSKKSNQARSQVAQRSPGAVAAIIQARPMRLDDPPKDPNRPEDLPRPVPDRGQKAFDLTTAQVAASDGEVSDTEVRMGPRH